MHSITLVLFFLTARLVDFALALQATPNPSLVQHVPDLVPASPSEAASPVGHAKDKHSAYVPKIGHRFHMRFGASTNDHLHKRSFFYYLKSDGFVTLNQREAAIFAINRRGQLQSNGLLVSANSNDAYIPFAANATVKSITTTWSFSFGLAWSNSAFVANNGRAGYCVGNDGRAYLILQSAPTPCSPQVNATPLPPPQGSPSSSASTSSSALGTSTLSSSSFSSTTSLSTTIGRSTNSTSSTSAIPSSSSVGVSSTAVSILPSTSSLSTSATPTILSTTSSAGSTTSTSSTLTTSSYSLSSTASASSPLTSSAVSTSASSSILPSSTASSSVVSSPTSSTISIFVPSSASSNSSLQFTGISSTTSAVPTLFSTSIQGSTTSLVSSSSASSSASLQSTGISSTTLAMTTLPSTSSLGSTTSTTPSTTSVAPSTSSSPLTSSSLSSGLSTMFPSSTSLIISSTASSSAAASSTGALCSNGTVSRNGPYFYGVGSDSYIVSCNAHFSFQTVPVLTIPAVADLSVCTQLCSTLRSNNTFYCVGTNWAVATQACTLLAITDGNTTSTASGTDYVESSILITQAGNASANVSCPSDDGKAYLTPTNDIFAIRCYSTYSANQFITVTTATSLADCIGKCSRLRYYGSDCQSTGYGVSNSFCGPQNGANYQSGTAGNNFGVYLTSLGGNATTVPPVPGALCGPGTNNSASFYTSTSGETYGISCTTHYRDLSSQLRINSIADLSICSDLCSTFRLNGSFSCIGTAFNYVDSQCLLLSSLSGNSTSGYGGTASFLLQTSGLSTSLPCNADAGKTYIASDGSQYGLHCSEDYSINMYYARTGASNPVNCTEQCVAANLLQSGRCAGVTYFQGICYQFNPFNYMTGTSGVYAMALLTPAYSCPANDRGLLTTQADTYIVSCGLGFSGSGQLSIPNVTSVAQCAADCSLYRQNGSLACTASSLLPASQTCQLYPSPSGNASLGDQTATTNILITTYGVTSNPTCPGDIGKTYYSPVNGSNTRYSIRCNQIYNPLNSAQAQVQNINTIKACADACAASGSCRAAALLQSTCYLFNTVGDFRFEQPNLVAIISY